MLHWGWRRDRTIQHLGRDTHDPNFVGGKLRLGGDGRVTPGFDPIIGQASGNGAREMDEPYPNYPAGNRRTTLAMPDQFVDSDGRGILLYAVDYGTSHGADRVGPSITVAVAEGRYRRVAEFDVGTTRGYALIISQQSGALPLEARFEVLSVPRR